MEKTNNFLNCSKRYLIPRTHCPEKSKLGIPEDSVALSMVWMNWGRVPDQVMEDAVDQRNTISPWGHPGMHSLVHHVSVKVPTPWTHAHDPQRSRRHRRNKAMSFADQFYALTSTVEKVHLPFFFLRSSNSFFISSVAFCICCSMGFKRRGRSAMIDCMTTGILAT